VAVGQELWVENDLNMGYTQNSDEYYEMWWEIFLEKHQDIADVIVVWTSDYIRWAETIKKIY